MTAPRRLLVRRPAGLQDYGAIWESMRAFTDARGPDTVDELWLLEHPPVFTLGQAGRMEHLLRPGAIPVVKTDRGGQVTYHGPGQLIAYLLLDLRRAGIGIRRLVNLLEQSVIDVLAEQGIGAAARTDAPGVYVDGAKIASLGLRVRKGCCYHGLALNVSLDLEPFGRVNPCGYPGLAVTRVADLVPGATLASVSEVLEGALSRRLGMVPERAV
ncbi:MAG: lipoyl(octanoyl) transferase LipB [Chromatiaceae bacterium]